MIVDPATGMPLQQPQGTVGAENAMGALNSVGLDQERVPLMYDMLGATPGVVTSSLWNVNRVSNTILGGGANPDSIRGLSGWSRNQVRKGTNRIRGALGRDLKPERLPGQGGFLNEGFRQTFSPSRFFRLTRAANIEGQGAFYSPFGMMSSAGNWAVNQGMKSKTVGATINKYLGFGGNINPNLEMGGQKVGAFSKGTMGRISAMGRISGMSASNLARRTPNIAAALADLPGNRTLNTMTGKAFDALDEAGQLAVRRAEAQGAIAATMQGQISGRIGGYFAGAQAARGGELATAQGLKNVAGSQAERGFRYATKSLEMGGVRGGLAKVAGSKLAAFGLKAAGPIGTMLMVRDIAMLGGKIIGAGARLAMDAGRSIMAPLNKGLMGNNFKDNAVAATARQRGVMAIANSRLNMRSVLGHEAAPMAGYYG